MQTKKLFNEDSEIEFIECECFIKPTITIDTLRKKQKTPIIELYKDGTGYLGVQKLNQFNLGLFGVPLSKKETWAPRQKYRYYIRLTYLPQDDHSRQFDNLAPNHILEFDVANQRVRLHGTFIQPDRTTTGWLNY